ncbi:MAG: hypothetical protein KDC79_08345 [Cyclobacteriaceae bacterium]|nr:hypothetical protein [Cyclobacteriaceae bacterium]
MAIRLITDVKSSDLNIKKIFKSDSCETLLFKLKKGEEIPNHVTQKKALLIMHKGKVVFHINTTDIELISGNTYEIPKDEVHNVKARADAIFFIVR